MTDQISKKALERRRMLQGAAAAGVGVGVWAAPNIATLGFAPAYATVCSTPVAIYEIGNRNTSCNCGSNPDKFAAYKILSNQASTFPGTVELMIGGCDGVAIGNSPECPPPEPDENAGICVGSSGLFCKAKVVVSTNQNGTPYYTETIPPIGGWAAMPRVPCGGEGNQFTYVSLVCSEHDHCLDQFYNQTPT